MAAPWAPAQAWGVVAGLWGVVLLGAGAAAGVVADADRGSASGDSVAPRGVAAASGAAVVWPRSSMSCSSKSPSRPTTPVTTPSREVGTCGDAVLTIARAEWPGACT